MEESDVRIPDQPTPMGSVWSIVLASMLLTAAVFGGYHWWRYDGARAEHQRTLEESAKLQEDLSAYIAYLEANGTSSPERYFNR